MNFDINKYIKTPKQITIPFLNASLESYKKQFDGQVFRFNKNATVEVPLPLVEHVYEAMREFGCFPIFPNMTKEEINEAYRDALMLYADGKLKDCIKAYQWKLDESKRNGSTVEKERRHERMIKWRDEIYSMMDKERPKEEEGSFNDVDREGLLNPFAGFENAVVETAAEREAKSEKRMANAKKTSFADVNLEDIL